VSLLSPSAEHVWHSVPSPPPQYDAVHLAAQRALNIAVMLVSSVLAACWCHMQKAHPMCFRICSLGGTLCMQLMLCPTTSFAQQQ
jgi:hypothetical protein